MDAFAPATVGNHAVGLPLPKLLPELVDDLGA
jgi:hypothetical protein